jgi:hypothetical protein
MPTHEQGSKPPPRARIRLPGSEMRRQSAWRISMPQRLCRWLGGLSHASGGMLGFSYEEVDIVRLTPPSQRIEWGRGPARCLLQ